MRNRKSNPPPPEISGENRPIRKWSDIANILGWSVRQTIRLVERPGSALGRIVKVNPDTGSPWAWRNDLIAYLNSDPSFAEGGNKLLKAAN